MGLTIGWTICRTYRLPVARPASVDTGTLSPNFARLVFSEMAPKRPTPLRTFELSCPRVHHRLHGLYFRQHTPRTHIPTFGYITPWTQRAFRSNLRTLTISNTTHLFIICNLKRYYRFISKSPLTCTTSVHPTARVEFNWPYCTGSYQNTPGVPFSAPRTLPPRIFNSTL